MCVIGGLLFMIEIRQIFDRPFRSTFVIFASFTDIIYSRQVVYGTCFPCSYHENKINEISRSPPDLTHRYRWGTLIFLR